MQKYCFFLATWAESEELAWSVQEYISSWEPTPADVAYLRETAPELLELLDDDADAGASEDPAPAAEPAPAAPVPAVSRVELARAADGRSYATFGSYRTRAAALRFVAGVIRFCDTVATLYGPDGAELGRWALSAGVGPGRRL